MDKYKKLASNTIIFAIGTFSSKVLSFLLMPFVTRMMGAGDYGAADLVQQTVNAVSYTHLDVYKRQSKCCTVSTHTRNKHKI